MKQLQGGVLSWNGICFNGLQTHKNEKNFLKINNQSSFLSTDVWDMSVTIMQSMLQTLVKKNISIEKYQEQLH